MKTKCLALIMSFLFCCLIGCGNNDLNKKESENKNSDSNIKTENISQEPINNSSTADDNSAMPDNNASISETSVIHDTNEEKLPDIDLSNNDNPIDSLVNDNLCKDNEEIVYSFKTSKEQKVVSLCINNEENYIIFRYGSKDTIEIEYPDILDDSWNSFAYCYYLRGGGPDNEGLDLNYITFKSNEYSYILYEKYYASADEHQYGIVIINNNGEETDLAGDADSVIGTLIDFRWDERIIQGSLVDSLVLE